MVGSWSVHGRLYAMFCEIITRLPAPVTDTAANMPSSGDHANACQSLSVVVLRVFHLMPSSEVITRLPMPL